MNISESKKDEIRPGQYMIYEGPEHIYGPNDAVGIYYPMPGAVVIIICREPGTLANDSYYLKDYFDHFGVQVSVPGVFLRPLYYYGACELLNDVLISVNKNNNG